MCGAHYWSQKQYLVVVVGAVVVVLVPPPHPHLRRKRRHQLLDNWSPRPPPLMSFKIDNICDDEDDLRQYQWL